DEDDGRRGANSERGQCRSRTEACHSPADPEDRGPDDNSRIDVLARRNVEAVGEEGTRKLQNAAETNEGHGDRAGHHEGEARVPRPRRNSSDIQKVQYLCRIRHSGDDEAEAEDQADSELNEGGHRRQLQCRITKTVAIPAAMKVMV